MSSILEIAKKLNKQFNDNNLAIKADVKPEYERMPTGALGFDYPTFGGAVYGRIITLAGLYHSGKTLVACMLMSAYQRKHPDKMCVYVDVEHSLDIKFQVRMTGLDTNKMVYFNPVGLSGEQILDSIIEFQKSEDVGLVVLDSIPALLPAEALEKDMEEDPGMRGTIAKPLHRFLVAMSGLVSKANNIFVMVNQVRVSGKTRMGAPIYSEPGGQAPQYYSSLKVRFGTRTFVKGDNVDANDGEGASGFRLKFAITKNKCGPTTRGGGFLTFSYDKGFDWLRDLLEIAYKFEFIKRINNVTYSLVDLVSGEVYEDEEGNPLTGKRVVLEEYIRTNPAFQKKYTDMLNKFISADEETYGNILDAREEAEIKEQEEAVEKTLEEEEQSRKSRRKAESSDEGE